MSQVDAIFDHGRFKVANTSHTIGNNTVKPFLQTQRTPTSLWTPFQKFYPNAAERPGRCASDTKRLADLSVVAKNPLMYDPVPSVGHRPLLVEGPNRADFTAIAVAAQVESVRKQKYNTIFVGRADGTISKVAKLLEIKNKYKNF
jgi:hypothetical protein